VGTQANCTAQGELLLTLEKCDGGGYGVEVRESLLLGHLPIFP